MHEFEGKREKKDGERERERASNSLWQVACTPCNRCRWVMWPHSGTTILVLHPSLHPPPFRRLSEKTETSPCIWKKEDKFKILAYWIIIRFAKLQVGGGLWARVCTLVPVMKDFRTRAVRQDNWVSTKLIDRAGCAIYRMSDSAIYHSPFLLLLSFLRSMCPFSFREPIETFISMEIYPRLSAAGTTIQHTNEENAAMKSERTITSDPVRMFDCLRSHNRRLEQCQDLWCSTMAQCCLGNVSTSGKALNCLDWTILL